MKKIQVWFREDQAELVVACLCLAKRRVNETPYMNDGHAMAGRFTARRIDEVLALFPQESKA